MKLYEFIYAVSFYVMRNWNKPNSKSKSVAYWIVTFALFSHVLLGVDLLMLIVKQPIVVDWTENYELRKLTYLPFAVLLCAFTYKFFYKKHPEIVGFYKEKEIGSITNLIVVLLLIIIPLVIGYKIARYNIEINYQLPMS